jgi:hypothetical protein
VEEFGSSGSAGSCRSIELFPCNPQREASEEIPSRRKAGKGISLAKIPPDRPGPMEEQPPQDDDPNSSTLNPMSFPLTPPPVFYTKGSFLKNWGWARLSRGLDPASASGF